MNVLLTPKDAARFLGCTEGHLALMRLQKRGPTYSKLGSRTIRYKQSDLDAYVDSHTVPSAHAKSA